MNPEDALRAALAADAERFAPSPGAWLDNQRRVRRRTRARRATLAAVTAAAVGVTGAVAVAWPRLDGGAPDAVRPAAPSASRTAAAEPEFAPPDRHGMSQADADALAEECLAYQPDAPPGMEGRGGGAPRLAAPADEYRMIFVLPGTAQSAPDASDVVALHARDQLVVCERTVQVPQILNDEREVPGWIEQPVESWGARWAHDYWRAEGVYSSGVARIEVRWGPDAPPVPAFMDNGFWFASGVGGPSSPRPVMRPYHEVTAYGRDGEVLFRNAEREPVDCYELPDGSTVGPDRQPMEPAPGQRCQRTYRWP